MGLNLEIKVSNDQDKEEIMSHRQRHIFLHKCLDELSADYILHNKKLLSDTTVMQLIEWSHQQTKHPTEIEE